MPDIFNHNLLDDSGWETSDADPEIQKSKIKREAATRGVTDISKAMLNHTFLGSGLKSEIIEIEENMRHLLTDGKHGYMYIESVLLSLGYPLNAIRTVFRRLTGVTVEEWMDVDKALWSVPPTIPGINSGWGDAKGSKYDFYFVMPYKNGYSVFGQKGDLQRDELDYCDCIDGILARLKELCKTVYIWDKPVDIKELQIKPDVAGPQVRPLAASDKSDKYNELDNYIYNNYNKMDNGTIAKVLATAQKHNDITREECEILRQAYLSIEADEPSNDVIPSTPETQPAVPQEIKDEVHKAEDKAMSNTLEKEMEEDTPSKFFDGFKEDEKMDTVPADVIDKVIKYINFKNEDLDNFKAIVQGFKYTTIDIDENIKNSTPVNRESNEVYFEANALITVLLKIRNNALPADQNEKNAFVIFSVVSGDIVTADYIKAENNRLYAMTEEGLSKLWSD